MAAEPSFRAAGPVLPQNWAYLDAVGNESTPESHQDTGDARPL